MFAEIRKFSFAFYSQTKHSVQKPHEIYEYGVNWIELWKEMQRKIYGFQQTRDLLVITDLSNYFDSIYIPELRKIISGYINGKESLLDILFKIIEGITWLPDYLPYTGRNLPTANLEAVRLLAHSFLFEIDSILQKKSGDSFTRWMDDIVVAVDTTEDAIDLLSRTSDVLKSRGLALNLSKTKVLSAKEAKFHFQIDENQYIDSIEEIVDGYEDLRSFRVNDKQTYKELEKTLYKSFKNHLKVNQHAKYYEKITKRYITTFSRLESRKLVPSLEELYKKYPGIRNNLMNYLSRIGYSKPSAQKVVRILQEIKLYDDISLFNICRLLTKWKIPDNDHGKEIINSCEEEIISFSKSRKNPFDFYCLLWFKTKYSHPIELFDFIKKYDFIWKSTPFLRRQVISILGRIYTLRKDEINQMLDMQISTSESQVVSVANSIKMFSEAESLEEKVRLYLFPQGEYQHRIYPLSKFVVLCSFLNSEKVRNTPLVRDLVKEQISDPFYKKWIEVQYAIS
ncbi:MAG: RNA-directed DNA polymerase [Bacteroidota bacterium]